MPMFFLFFFITLLLHLFVLFPHFSLFFFNDTATTEIYTLSLHDALPITSDGRTSLRASTPSGSRWKPVSSDRKSTRLNSSHMSTSYAVFCLKKKKVTPALLFCMVARKIEEF